MLWVVKTIVNKVNRGLDLKKACKVLKIGHTVHLTMAKSSKQEVLVLFGNEN